ncbi:Xanthine phosphoribosyltransferase 1 [Dissophora globulifera]|nr:Xanthine phosphoribosyltransferase 1 [Dissophora globulifera]
MAASTPIYPQRRHTYHGIRRHFKGIIIGVLLLCLTVNLIIYLAAEGPPVILEPAEPVQRRAIIVPTHLRDGRPNKYFTGTRDREKEEDLPSWIGEWFQYQRLNPSQVGDDIRLETVMDLVYTWVNGSEPELHDMKEQFKERSPMFRALKDLPDDFGRPNRVPGAKPRQKANSGDDSTTNRFRDLNELKYSIRSVAAYSQPGMFRKIHILRTEVVDPESGQTRGQVPQWMDLDKVSSSSPNRELVELVSHSKIYDNVVDNLPSFNSLSIESQMHHIPGMADIFVYLNDDVFFGKPLSIADFWTPLYGFVLHMDPLSRVQPWQPKPVEHTAEVAEWPSLQYTNSVLSKQFGARHRVYIAHIPHILSVSILEEMQATWPEEFVKTSSHRFRGEGGAHDLQVSFMLAHYVMERFRETQLTSYWKYRLDRNQDGKLDWEERQQLIRMVDQYDIMQQEKQKNMPPPGQPVNSTFPSFLKQHVERLESVGLLWTNETWYALTGMDEYPFMLSYGNLKKSSKHQEISPYLIPQVRRKCKFELDFCLGADFKNSSIGTLDASTGKGSIFERLAFTEFHCGDCLLHMVRQTSEVPGMSALMPEDRTSPQFRAVVRDLRKYNYVIGQSQFSFLQLRNGVQEQHSLARLMEERDKKTFFCVNDDIQDHRLIVERVKSAFSEFLEVRLPVASPWEKEE